MGNALYRRVRATAGGNALFWRTSAAPAGAISSTALIISTVVGNITTQIPLAASAVSVTSAQGSFNATIPFDAAALMQALVQAQLQTQIRLNAVAQSNTAVSAVLANRAPIVQAVPTLEFTQGQASTIDVSQYGSDPDGDPLVVLFSQGPQGLPAGVTYNQALKRLEYDGRNLGLVAGSGGFVSTDSHRLVFDDGFGLGSFARSDTIIGNATLSSTIPLAVFAQAHATASGTLTQPQDLLATAASQVSAPAQLTTAIQMVSASAALVSASGSLGATLPIAGIAASIVTATGELRLQIEIAVSALIQAAVSGGLTTQIFLGSVAQASTSVFAGFGAALGGTAVAGTRVRAGLTSSKPKNLRLVIG